MLVKLREEGQITIPKELVDKLGLSEGDKFDVFVNKGIICFLPVAVYPKRYLAELRKEIEETKKGGSEFFEQVLADLIAQGFTGNELLAKFKLESKKVRPAIEKMIAETDALIKRGEGKISLDELFRTEG